MKKLFLIGLSILCFSSYSQNDWELIYGSDSSARIGGVFMVDTAHTWAKGICFSPDWGGTWERQFYNEDYVYSDIFFADTLNGWTVGWSEALHTNDGGETWTLQTVPNPLGLDMEAVFFINPDTGWIAGSYKTIYATYDGGNNWVSQHNHDFGGHYFLYDIHFYDALHGCAVGGGLQTDVPIVMTTEDGGINWTEIFPSGEEVLRSVQFVNDTVVWCCDFSGKIYRSTDSGFTWEFVQSVPGIWPYDIHFFDESNAIIGGNHTRIAYTSDAWSTFQVQELNWPNMISNFSFANGLNGIAAGNNNIMRTRDGGHTWKRINDRFYRISFFTPNNGWIIQEHLNKNFLHTTDGGFTWTETDAHQLGYLLQMSFPSDELGFAVTNMAELLKTNNAGTSWETLKMPLESDYFSDLQFLDEDTGYLISYPQKFCKTVDGGRHWETKSFDNVNYLNSIDFLDASEGWLVGSNGLVGHTTDGGSSWDTLYLPSYTLTDVDFVNSLTGFILSGQDSVYRTNNGGQTWEVSSLGMQFPENICFTDPLNGWITDENKVIRTTDGGISWTEELDAESQNFEHQITGFFAMDTNYAWICTMDGRVFSLSGYLNINEDFNTTSFNYYPNPVTDQLTVELNTEIKEKLMVRLFSIDGRRILKREFSTVPDNRFTLDLSTLSSGIYILNIQGSSLFKSLKLIKE